MNDTFDKKYCLSPEGLDFIQGLARDGLTDEQIATRIGITRVSLWRWRNKHPELAKACREGKDVADCKVESALYKNAIEGNVTAQIFWLKNRKPDKWNVPQPLPKIGITQETIEVGLESLAQLLIPKPPTGNDDLLDL